ncbi:MAG: AAA family ATPase, partial [Tetragenococcus halophilus]|nr:AAA family ATPase [Tetragenococcus halophilus]
MIYQFSEAIRNNIERTYTYAFVAGRFGYKPPPNEYNAQRFFTSRLKDNPFEAFMELDQFAFKKTLNTLKRYGIPYTPEQEYRARIYYDVTEQMAKERSDSIHRYVDGDLKGTRVVKLTGSYLLTTQTTVDAAKFIKRLPKNKKTGNVLYENKINDLLSDSKEQMNALTQSVDNQISCVIGRAGTGKSYVTAEIVNQLQLNDKTVAILAPTHKAKEALQDKISLGEVQTIHSFVHRPFDCDVIVIDESGMLSTPLFNQLAKVYEGQQLVFIGDKNQLPPIEYGRPFELIQEQFTTSELRKNKRSEASDILSLGNQILGIAQNANMTLQNIEV